MIMVILIATIIGAIVGALTGISLIGWIAGIFTFICGIPGILYDTFIGDTIDYVQDREDDRQLMHELDEDERMDRYLTKLDELEDRRESRKLSKHDTYIDNRQIHLHKHYDDYDDDLDDDLNDDLLDDFDDDLDDDF